MNKQAVLLLDFGGPSNLDAVGPFLTELFSDRAILPLPIGRKTIARLITACRLKKVQEQYQLIGGGSPLIPQTQKLARDLQKRLAQSGLHLPVYTAMRYTPPFIAETLWRMVQDDIHKMVVLPMFPQFSFATTGSVFGELEKILQKKAPDLKAIFVREWWQKEEFLLGWCQVIHRALASLPSDAREGAHLLFTAHSLPVRLVKMKNDPYPGQIHQCVTKIIEMLGLSNAWHLSFQSKIGPVKWLGPSTMETVKKLGHQGVKNLIFIPISFLTDHIETLYEVDQLLIPEAKAAGVEQCVRTEALVQTPHLAQALEKIVLEKILQ